MSAYVVVHLAHTRRVKQTRGTHGPDDPGLHSSPAKERGHAALADESLKRLLAKYGAEVVHSPDSKEIDDESPQSATIACRDMACADKLATALREMDGIETAYAKPGEELP